jgi:hypothetical protein
MPVSVVVLVLEVADHHPGLEKGVPVVAVANVTLEGSAGSLVACFALRGLCLFCGPSTPEDRPTWLKRSVASPLLGYADRPVRATHDGGRRVP